MRPHGLWGGGLFDPGHLFFWKPQGWNRIMELPEELLLVICEHLQPPRYEDEAAPPDCHNYYARRRAAHRPAAAVKLVSRGFRGLMARTARVVMAKDYRSWAEFAAQTHRHAELFEANEDWVNDNVLRSLHKVMPRLRAACGQSRGGD